MIKIPFEPDNRTFLVRVSYPKKSYIKQNIAVLIFFKNT